MNFITESTKTLNWSYGHSDWKYISAIHKRFGSIPLKTYPYFSFTYLFYIFFLHRIKIISILNYLDYDIKKTKKLLSDEVGWIDYGGKHYESIYTRFYQGYVLPKKFHIDKRYSHFSDLVNSGQMVKAEAKKILSKQPYEISLQNEDKIFVLKKLGLSEEEFDKIMSLPRCTFRDYSNSHNIFQFIRHSVNILRKFGLYPK